MHMPMPPLTPSRHRIPDLGSIRGDPCSFPDWRLTQFVCSSHPIAAHVHKRHKHTRSRDKFFKAVVFPRRRCTRMLKHKRPPSLELQQAQFHIKFQHCKCSPLVRTTDGRKSVRTNVLQRREKCTWRTNNQQLRFVLIHAPFWPGPILIVQAVPSFLSLMLHLTYFLIIQSQSSGCY